MRFRFLLLVIILLAISLGLGACGLVEGGSSSSGGGDEPDPNSGTIIIESQTDPSGQAGIFTYTGVPTGTITTDSTLVFGNLDPGTYTTTEVDPAPDFDVTAVECDDDGSASPSSGDASSRTAVINLEAGETVRCTFTNTQRGTLVVASQTVPDGAGGSILYTGVPSGTIPTNGTLVAANLQPGTYTSTQVDPAPKFDLTAVECDDGGSTAISSGDPTTRSAIFNLDPGEMVTCTFTNTRRGTAIVVAQTDPPGLAGNFQYTGVPTGTVTTGGSLVVADLEPGTYTTTEVDPAPDFELTEITCDDEASASPSSGDPSTRTAVINIDPGETVLCTFTHVPPDGSPSGSGGSGGDGSGGGSPGDGSSGGSPGEGINPFEEPDEAMENFPLPDETLPGAGTFAAPRPGPWTVTHFSGQLDCGLMQLDIPASPPESGVIEVLDDGATLIATGLEDAQGTSITMNADPDITGRYTGSFEGMEQGVPVTINYFWQVVTDEYIVGFLTASMTVQENTCTIYRPYELNFSE